MHISMWRRTSIIICNMPDLFCVQCTLFLHSSMQVFRTTAVVGECSFWQHNNKKGPIARRASQVSEWERTTGDKQQGGQTYIASQTTPYSVISGAKEGSVGLVFLIMFFLPFLIHKCHTCHSAGTGRSDLVMGYFSRMVLDNWCTYFYSNLTLLLWWNR